MSEVKGSDPVYVPAVFPSKGRLPCDVTAVRANYRQQMAEERRYRQEESGARGGPGVLTCAHRRPISLFFDGAQNNQRDSSFEGKLLVSGVFPAELDHQYEGMTVMGKWNIQWLWSLLFLSMAGCSAGESDYLGGNLNGVNHTTAAINYFSVNGYGGANIAPHGYGGGMCCAMLPRTWRPGLVMKVEWETDPNPYEKIKRKTTGYGFDEEAYAKHKANYQQHTAIVPLPPYDDEGLCSLEVHFLPCNQVKVTTSCWGYPSPKNPIKEPLKMEEPDVCPK